LYFYNARYYDPFVGQFTQPDSLVADPMNPAAWNRYSYVYNSPSNFVDPSGHFVSPDTILDFAAFVYDLNEFDRHPSWGNLAWLGVDVFFLALPVVVNVAAARHLGKADDAKRILVVGENSFEYSLALRNSDKLSPNDLIVATSYESFTALQNKGFKIPPRGRQFWVMDKVDARNLAGRFGNMKFDAIIFNNPHAGKETANLIEEFIQSARGQLRQGGEIHINVTQSLIESRQGVRQALTIPSNANLADLPRFIDSPYYAPYRAYYTQGDPFPYGHDVGTLLNRVFRKR
jgi:hypothetical protein